VTAPFDLRGQRHTGPRLPVWRESASGGPRRLGAQPAASAADHGGRTSALSERLLFAAYGFGPRPLGVES